MRNLGANSADSKHMVKPHPPKIAALNQAGRPMGRHIQMITPRALKQKAGGHFPRLSKPEVKEVQVPIKNVNMPSHAPEGAIKNPTN